MIPTDRDALDIMAGEFVLGTLTPDEMAEVAVALDGNADLAQAVMRWRKRLSPLDGLIPRVSPPPELWTRIEAALAPQTPAVLPLRPRSATMRWVGLGVTALAASLALFIAFRPAPPRYVAELTPPASAASGTVSGRWTVTVNGDGQISVLSVGSALTASDRSLELWSIEAGEAPRSLGVVPADGHYHGRLPASPHAGLTIAITLEPKGGSPDGNPTGPVVYAGTLADKS